MLHSMQDLSSLVRDWTVAPCSGSMESWPLNHQESLFAVVEEPLLKRIVRVMWQEHLWFWRLQMQESVWIYPWPMAHYGAAQVVLLVENLPANAGVVRDVGSIPGSGRSLKGGNGNPFQHSCLENPMDTGAWRAIVHRAAKSQTRLKWLSRHTCLTIKLWTKNVTRCISKQPSSHQPLRPSPPPPPVDSGWRKGGCCIVKIVGWKKNAQSKSREIMFYLVDKTEDLSPEHSISPLRDCSEGVREEHNIKDFLQQR